MNDVVTAFLRQVLPPTTCLNAVDVFRDTYLREWNKGVQYIQGVTSLLSRLAHRYTLVLVTNTHSSELVKTHLMRMEVEDFFSIVVTSVEHGKRKPSESIFRHALKASAAENSTAVYVGDSFQTDYLGSTTVGIRCLLIDPYKKHGIPARDRLMHVLDLETVLSLEY